MVARKGLLLALAAALVGCSSTPAPIYAGSLSGSATYSDGGDSSGIVITVSGPVSAAALTDLNGTWSVASLPPGTYAISAVAPSALEPLLETQAVVAQGAVVAPALTFTGVGGISGNILSGGAAAPGVIVLVQGTGQSAVTDSSGSYQLSGIIAGTYNLIASLSGQAGASQSGVPVVHGKTTAAGQMVLNAPPIGGTTLSGSIVIQGVAAQQGLPVSLQGPTSSASITAADGSFTFSGLADGNYTLSAQVRSTSPSLETLSVIIAAGQPVTGATLTFAPVGIVRGKATLSSSATGNASIAVTALGTASSAVTDDLGRYQLANVPAGNATLQAAIIGGGSATAQVAVVWNQEVVAPDMLLTTAQAAATGEISGHALFAGATDSSGITVVLTGPVSTSQETAADGAFDFTAIPSGSYQLTATATGTREGSVSTQITLGATAIAGLSLQLTPIASIAGLVTELDGTPVPAALVFLNGGSESAVTAIDGTYLLGGVPVGSALALQASNSNELSQLIQLAPLARGEVSHPSPLVLTAHGSIALIAGAAALVDGTPAASANVIASGSGLTSISATASGTGAFSFAAPEGVYSLSLSASDGSSETVPVASLVGASGLVWGGNAPLPIGTVELQRAARLASAPNAAILARAQSSLNPTIRATTDALILGSYSEFTGATESLGLDYTATVGTGTLWLESGGTAVPFPSAGIYVPEPACGLSATLFSAVQPGPVLGPEHTALYSLPPVPETAGPLEVGRPDGTVLEVLGPPVDNTGSYYGCLVEACEYSPKVGVRCSCTQDGYTLNPYANPIVSGGDTVAYLAWEAPGDSASKDEAVPTQIFAFNINDALGGTSPTVTQITSDNVYPGDTGVSLHSGPIFVSPDGKWLWYASRTVPNDDTFMAALSVVSIADCVAGGACAPSTISTSAQDAYNALNALVLSVSADGSTLLLCSGPETVGGRNSNGSSSCDNTLIATVDGTTVRDLYDSPVFQFTASDGTELLVYDNQDDGQIEVEPFAAVRARHAQLMPDDEYCEWDWQTDGVGILITAGYCSETGLESIGGLPAKEFSAVRLSFTNDTVPAVVTAEGTFTCVAPISGTKIAYSDSSAGILELVDVSGDTPANSQIDSGANKTILACGATQRARSGILGLQQHWFLPSSNRLAWIDDSSESESLFLSITDVTHSAQPTTLASIGIPSSTSGCAIANDQGSLFNTEVASASPARANMSADGTTAIAIECGLDATPSISGGVTMLSSDGSQSGTQPIALQPSRQTHQILADGTVVFNVWNIANAASGAGSLATANLVSGQVAITPVPGLLGYLDNPYLSPDQTSAVFPIETSATSDYANLASLVYIGAGGATSVAASQVPILSISPEVETREPGRVAANTSGIQTPSGGTNDGNCPSDISGYTPGLGVEASPDGSALLFRSGTFGTPNLIYQQQGSAGLLQTLRFSDGQVQSMVGRTSQATWLPDGTVLGVRLDSPAPYGFQDGLYLAAPWGQP